MKTQVKRPKGDDREYDAASVVDRISLIKALNAYANAFTLEEKMPWLMAYLNKEHQFIAEAISKKQYHYPYSLSTMCAFARLISLGVDIPECNVNILEEMIGGITVTDPKPEPSRKSTLKPINTLLYRYDEALDDTITSRRAVFLVLDGTMEEAREVIEEAQKLLDEVNGEEAGDYYPQQHIRLIRTFCNQIIQQAPKPATPPEKRFKNDHQRVANLSLMEEYQPLKLKSAKKVKLVGAKRALLYHPQRRDILYIEGDLTVSGTTMLEGIDKERSFTQNVRSPHWLFDGSITLTLEKMKLLATPKRPHTSRFNKGDWLLLFTG